MTFICSSVYRAIAVVQLPVNKQTGSLIITVEDSNML
jgi:hypothetical protein